MARAKRLSAAISGVLVGGLFAATSAAEPRPMDLQALDELTGAAEADDTSTLDLVEVTGSRLKRAQIEGAVPVVVIDREQIDASGDISVADVLRDSNFASFGNFRPQSGSSAQSLATIDLRGLGSGRTLVLIDGRRAPTNPMSASSGSDLNTIPLAAVERIEILSDGASAIYGSEAIGGVVNIITRRDFNGAEFRYGHGATAVKGGDLEEMSLVFGAFTGWTRVLVGASASKRGMLFTRDQIGGEGPGVSVYGNNYYDWDLGGDRAVPGFDCDQGAFYLLGNGLCSFDFTRVAADEAKLGNKSVFVRADHRIDEDWLVYATASATRVETFGRYAPTPGIVVVEDGTPNDINGGVACGAGGCAPGATDGLPTYYFHRFAAAGNRDGFTDAVHTDYLVGFQGQLGERVGLDAGLRRTDYKYIELGRGYIVSDLADQLASSGQYDLSDPYGADPSVLATLQATISREARSRTDEAFALLNVDLFEMAGGPSHAAFGAELRRDAFHDRYDSLSAAEGILGTAGGPAGGERDSRAAYFEWLLPFSQQFDLTLAGRWDSYSDYGSDFSPKVSLRWQPLDALALRASYGEGFRAPALDILTQQPVFSAEPVRDPQSCLALGQPADCQLQVDSYFLPNPDLRSERSEQYSVGLVADPFDGLDLSLDYYSIRIDNSITQLSAQDIINWDNDLDVLLGPLPPHFEVQRGANGRILRVVSGYLNQGRLETDGLDLRINAAYSLGGFGEVRHQLSASKTLGYSIQPLDVRAEFAGRFGYPDLRATLSTVWARGDFSVGLVSHFIDGHSSGTPATTVGSYTTHDVQLTWRAPWNAVVSVGATNAGDRYPVLASFDGRPFNFYLYDAYGRTTYLRYTQAF